MAFVKSNGLVTSRYFDLGKTSHAGCIVCDAAVSLQSQIRFLDVRIVDQFRCGA